MYRWFAIDSPAIAMDLAAERQLQDGEAIILAVKPSRWFVLLASWPVVLLALMVAGATWAAGEFYGAKEDPRLVVLVCSGVACTRVTIACFQWHARLYILTDRRVLRIRGILREDVYQCPLKDIRDLRLVVTLPERPLGVGTLLFQRDKPDNNEGDWFHLARPAEVERAVREALSRTR